MKQSLVQNAFNPTVNSAKIFLHNFPSGPIFKHVCKITVFALDSKLAESYYMYNNVLNRGQISFTISEMSRMKIFSGQECIMKCK